MRSAWRMIFVLGLVSLVSGAILAAFYTWMTPRIEAQQLRAQFEVGFKQVFPDAADFKEVQPEQPLPANVEEPVYEALDATGNSLGLVYNVEGQGFQGPVKVAVGIQAGEGRVAGVAVLSHTETAGLGSRVEEPSFRDQFQGKLVTDAFEVGSDVDGITGATVSSRAVTNAVGRTAPEVLQAFGYDLPQAGSPPAPASGKAPVGDDAVAVPAGPPVEAASALLGAEVEVAGPIWQARDAEGTLTALLTEVSAEGFGGPIRVLVAVDPQAGTVRGIRILEQNETEGLGSRVADAEFTAQFEGKALDAPFQLGEDVDGISHATISSQAVTDAVARAVQQIAEMQGQER